MTKRKIFTSSLAVLGLSLSMLAVAQDQPAKESAQVGPFEVAPHWSRYDYPKSIGEGQAFHIVVKGDTLWDIAGRYLGNPYLWPQIWEANSYIKRARLIYPGDPVFLPSVQMADKPVGGEEPADTTTAKAPQEMGIPEWLDMDALVSAASQDTVRYAGYISASIEDESLKIKSMEAQNGTLLEKPSASTREYVYLDRGANAGLKAGDLYTIHRRSRTIKHPVTGKKVGYRIDTTGVARILLVAEGSARAVIESAGREIVVGDYLRPITEVESPLVKRRVVVEGGNLALDGSPAGYLVDIDDDAVSSATGFSVGVDMGTGAGLSVGRVLTVYRQGDPNDSVTKRALGAAVVLAVRENFSVARVLYAREEIHIGDRILIQP